MAYHHLTFQDDAAPFIEDVEQHLVAARQSPDDLKLIRNSANSLRTLHGVANLFNLDNMSRLASLAADGLDRICKAGLQADPAFLKTILELLAELRQAGDHDMGDRVTHNLSATLAPFAGQSLTQLSEASPATETRIMVVDDEDINRILLEEFIRSFSQEIKITSVATAAEAIYHYLTEDFDLVFLDIMMPEVDGNHFLTIVEKNRQLENIGGDANIVVQTAVQSLAELLAIVHKESVLEVIRKPFPRERICTCIERYCPAFRHTQPGNVNRRQAATHRPATPPAESL